MFTESIPLPESQYGTETNLAARQRLWEYLTPPFDVVHWTLDLACITPDMRVLDVGCGNGKYQQAVSRLGAHYIGIDTSLGMLGVPQRGQVVNADVTQLPFARNSFDAVICPHVLYHVPNISRAIAQLRYVLRPGGICVAVTNGARHRASLLATTEEAASSIRTGWKWPSPHERTFSLENGAPPMLGAFESVEVVHPSDKSAAFIKDPEVAASYIASVADIFGQDVPWDAVVQRVRLRVAEIIARDGYFMVENEVGAIIAR